MTENFWIWTRMIILRLWDEKYSLQSPELLFLTSLVRYVTKLCRIDKETSNSLFFSLGCSFFRNILGGNRYLEVMGKKNPRKLLFSVENDKKDVLGAMYSFWVILALKKSFYKIVQMQTAKIEMKKKVGKSFVRNFILVRLIKRLSNKINEKEITLVSTSAMHSFRNWSKIPWDLTSPTIWSTSLGSPARRVFPKPKSMISNNEGCLSLFK